MHNSIFITGIGTGVGKTVVAAIIAKALNAGYWKPVQAGYANGTDSEWVRSVLTGSDSTIFPEVYKFKLAASPHLAAKDENEIISIERIATRHSEYCQTGKWLIIEGAGGLMVPLNRNEFVLDLIRKLNSKVILVSRNYLGSINHSLLTAGICRQNKIDVLGWVFNDQFMNYEEDIVQMSNYPRLGSIGKLEKVDGTTIAAEAGKWEEKLRSILAKDLPKRR